MFQRVSNLAKSFESKDDGTKRILKCHDQQCNNQMYELSKENIIFKDAQVC